MLASRRRRLARGGPRLEARALFDSTRSLSLRTSSAGSAIEAEPSVYAQPKVRRACRIVCAVTDDPIHRGRLRCTDTIPPTPVETPPPLQADFLQPDLGAHPPAKSYLLDVPQFPEI